MFPLVHYFVNRQIFGTVPTLMALGGIFPDLAAGAGLNRDKAHCMGEDFHLWCKKNAPEAIDLAIGISSHGIKPYGVDYYSDECWPEYIKGWCFMQGEPYMPEVAAATNLPENLIWWKAHNFVEMSYELITNNDHPYIKDDLLAALHDIDAQKQAAAILSEYTGAKAELIVDTFANAPNIFAIENISPQKLAFKQNLSYRIRHNIHNANTEAMANLLSKMSEELKAGYYPFMKKIISYTAEAIKNY